MVIEVRRGKMQRDLTETTAATDDNLFFPMFPNNHKGGLRRKFKSLVGKCLIASTALDF